MVFFSPESAAKASLALVKTSPGRSVNAQLMIREQDKTTCPRSRRGHLRSQRRRGDIFLVKPFPRITLFFLIEFLEFPPQEQQRGVGQFPHLTAARLQLSLQVGDAFLVG